MKGSKLASDIKFYSSYSKWIESQQRLETWSDSVDRVMNMHRSNPKLQEAFKNPKFVEYFQLVEQQYKEKNILGSQRALQFGGDPILKHNAKLYNCISSYCDREVFFKEATYLLLCGCGVGFSVQKHHIKKLPTVSKRSKELLVFSVSDSIEGWADAFGCLISSYMKTDTTFEKYWGKTVVFDLSQIRPKGAYISGGFKAPGPDGLRNSLEEVDRLLEQFTSRSEGQIKVTSVVAYDIVMHIANAVLSGGVRRSATICLFSLDDEEMMNAKTGNWFTENSQRARSNNSVVLKRGEVTEEQFREIFQKTRNFGEPGFYFVEDYDQITNPCSEIGFYPQTSDGRSGWQACNLSTINGAKMNTKEKFLKACIASAVIGTIQASYTDFPYLSPESKEIIEKEALIGCSVTGWMNNPDILLDEPTQREGAELTKQINQEISQILGINQASRTTCVKPEGNASNLLESASGVHGDHFEQFFRCIQMNEEEDVLKYIQSQVPEMCEESVWSKGKTDTVLFIPITPSKKSVFKSQLVGIKQLEVVKSIQNNWVEYGTNVELCTKPFLRHSVSNTIEVENWDEIVEYLWQNKQHFACVSFLPRTGDKIYNQAPFTSVLNEQQLIEKYGAGAILGSGLVVDGLEYFSNLWEACDLLLKDDLKLIGTRKELLLRKDWLKRAKIFAKRYLKNNLEMTTYCLKDIHLYHKWQNVTRVLNQKEIDLSKITIKPQYTDVDTLGAIACQGGACEVPDYILNAQQQPSN